MKRIVDKEYFTYSAETSNLSGGIYVKCPKCGGLGRITYGADKRYAYFKCSNCGDSKEKDLRSYRYDVHNECKKCQRYYRVDIMEEDKQHFSILNVACPHCGYVMSGTVHKTDTKVWYGAEIKNGYDPYFGYELWFLTTFDNKPIWAINREHLDYMIEYLNADLREKPAGRPMKTQADHLPTFMKTAKNRERIVKLLKNMLQE